ncbi:MAG: RluA family pseudouridine synthase [Chlamydiae bacterium]|nr:RluA family pseudouridine synthase [Chlamydiota bacterium]
MNRPLSISSSDPHFLSVPSEAAGMRLDKFLADAFPQFSRSYFQYLIDFKLVLLNGEPVKKRILLEVADEIEIQFELAEEWSLTPEPMDFEILFEDEHFLAVNKPAGLVVHPAPGHWTGTFVHGLLAHCQHLSTCDDPLRPGIVHRLDKDTSGVLLAAKTRPAHGQLAELFSSRKMEKMYLAVCSGRPPNGLVNAPIGRHPVHRKEMTVLSEGKEAISLVQTLAFNSQVSLVSIRPQTGRTHQIRVHLKHLGHPVLGDPVYGSDRVNSALRPNRLLLHAYRLHFIHPFTGQKIELCAPLPDDLRQWVKKSFQHTEESSRIGL